MGGDVGTKFYEREKKENMAVLKNLRKLSAMEFYKNAIRLRKELTDWIMRDFGNKHTKRSVKQIIKNIDEKDQKVIDDVFEKYDKTPNQAFASSYPMWFVEFERDVMIKLLHDLISNITSANSIYAVHEFEFDLRREYQDKAIINCYQLCKELQYIAESFNTDLNMVVRLLDTVEKEVDLLKGWRQSDNKKRKQSKEK